MTIQTLALPVTAGPNPYSFTVQLEGVNYDFTFYFNVRDDHWYMDIGLHGTLSIVGVKLVCSANLLHQFTYMQDAGILPPGTFAVVDTNFAGGDPDLSTFGSTILLTYQTSQ